MLHPKLRMSPSPPAHEVLDLCSDEDAPPERQYKRHRKEVGASTFFLLICRLSYSMVILTLEDGPPGPI